MDDFTENIYFVDVVSKQNAFIVVRVVDGKIGIAISLDDDGDIEAFLPSGATEILMDALNRALSKTRNADKDEESTKQFPDRNCPDQSLNPN